jgi:hypothetical protein
MLVDTAQLMELEPARVDLVLVEPRVEDVVVVRRRPRGASSGPMSKDEGEHQFDQSGHIYPCSLYHSLCMYDRVCCSMRMETT